jgi:putative ABC transport system permease protein
MSQNRSAYRLLLLLYPARFRREYGGEALRQLHHDLREARSAGPIRSVLERAACLADFCLAGLAERLTSMSTGDPNRSRKTTGHFMSTVFQDIRFALRGFIKRPGFALVAIVSLALGVGANTAIFSVANGVLFRPLPYDEPDRVVQILGTRDAQLTVRNVWLSYPEIADLRATSEAFENISARQGWSPILYDDGVPTRVSGMAVSDCYFDLFGLPPALGRFFLPEEGELGHEPVVVLSYGSWQQRFAGDRSVIGQTLDLDGTRYSIVGVAPQQFVDPFGGNPQMWRSRPPTWDETHLARITHSWRAIGRLASGATLGQAQADVDRIWSGFQIQYPDSHNNEGVRLQTAKQWMTGGVQTGILVLLGAVGLVLLIACANVASLFLTRTLARSREVAVRASLGAGRGRIVRQLVTEVCLLFLIGGAVSLPVAWLGTDSLLSLGGTNLPRFAEIRVDWAVMGFALGLSLVTGLIFGLTAAYPAVRSDLAPTLQAAGRSASGDTSSQRLRGALVVMELALAMVLLTGSGLLLRSLWSLQQVEPGFRPENVLTLRTYPRAGQYGEPEEITNLYQEMTARLATVPGVTAAGAVNFIPMTSAQNCEFVWRDDLPVPPRETLSDYDFPRCLEVRVVTPDYFDAMGITVLRGRGFTAADDAAAPPVTLISQAAAELGFRGEDPLGKRVTLYETRDFLPNVSREIVGVVSNVRKRSLAAEAVPAIYFAHAQEPDPWRRRVMTLALRTAGNPTELADLARATVWQIDDETLIDFVRPMTTLVNRTTAQPRFRTTLVLIFGAVALLLSTIGVAGVVGYALSRRIPEIGLRIALGAESRDIYSTVMSQGLKLTAWGLILGVGGALASTKLLSGILFGVPPHDPASFVAASLLMAVVALVAIWIPARRALRVDPVKTLNAE